MTNTIEIETGTTSQSVTSRWLDRVDQWCERVGDSLNPILVKETRQALKSRQFVVTFSILLFAALAWTIVGSLMLMPRIYTSPSASRMLVGYYAVLALPMLMVVPLAAYRSLEGEIDDGTLELLSITALSPWQIVLGKLASAMLQMLLYFVALFPCVAYAYTLRGVDLPTTLLMIAILVVAGILLTVIALFFAPLSRSRTGRIATLLAIIMILFLGEWFIGLLCIGMILEGNPLSVQWTTFLVVATVLLVASLCHLLLTATAAQLTPESENRSTHLRVSLLILTSLAVGLSAYAVESLPDGEIVFLVLTVGLAAIWTVCGALLVAESSVMTPRIQRELPSTFLGRMCLTWLTPGPATGLVFASSVIAVLTGCVAFGFAQFGKRMAYPPSARVISDMQQFCVVYASYLIGFLIVVRMLVAVVRIKNNPRAEIGLAALVVVAMVSALVPYSIQLHFNDYRPYEYSWTQITNWVWTLGLIESRGLPNGTSQIIVISVALAFLGALTFAATVTLPRRIATPKRVQEEREAQKQMAST